MLVGANMPAVLVEMGFLTNPSRNSASRPTTFRMRVVQALVDGIVRYRGAAAAQPTPESAR